MASRLNRGWPPGPSWLVTCWPSMFSWNSRTSPRSCTGTLPIAVVRLPGAISASDVQSRPCTGSSDICSGSMLEPRVDCVDVDERRLAGHGHAFGDAGDGHLHVEADRLADEQRHAGCG